MKKDIHINTKLGFTLIELLLVIAIISILSTAAVVSLNVAKKKARDARRFAEVAQVQKAVELYFAEHGVYPNPNCYGLPAVAACSSTLNGTNWIPTLGPMPVDPINTTVEGEAYSYIYTHRANGHDDYFYILFKLEAEEAIDRCNNSGWLTIGWSCLGGGDFPT